MDHFVEEIDNLRSSLIQYQKAGGTVIRKLSALSRRPKDIKSIEYLWTYVFDAVLPCLEKYYSNQHLAALQSLEYSRYFARRRLYASRVVSAVRDLSSVRTLSTEHAKILKTLFLRISALDIDVGPELQLTLESTVDGREDAEVWMNASWTKFVNNLSSLPALSDLCAPQAGLGSFCELIVKRGSDNIIGSIVHVLTLLGTEQSPAGDKLCLTLLDALVELLRTGQTTHLQYLHAGVLQSSMRLVSYPSEQIVLNAVHLTWEILSNCKSEAHAEAEKVLQSMAGAQFLTSCRICIKMFFDHLKATNKQRKRIALAADEVLEQNDDGQAVRYATLACELLEIIELLSRENETVQNSLRKYEVLNAVVDFMVEVERNVLSEINRKNTVFVLMLAKGFLVLVASLSGPNTENLRAVTYTNILSMIDRLFAKLSYRNSDDLMHDQLTATVRSSSVAFLRVLFELPSDAIVAKRVLETIDWALFFRSWGQSKNLFDFLIKELGFDNVSDFMLTAPNYRLPNIVEYKSLMVSIESGLNASASDSSRERRAALLQIASNVLHEGFLMAIILNFATDDFLFGPDMPGPAKRQQDLAQLMQADDNKHFGFFTERLASVEITRGGVLERLLFRLPEDCVTLKEDTGFNERISEALFLNLSTESDEARQASLLERMIAFSDNLLCESELAHGPHSWIMTLHPWYPAHPLARYFCLCLMIVNTCVFETPVVLPEGWIS